MSVRRLVAALAFTGLAGCSLLFSPDGLPAPTTASDGGAADGGSSDGGSTDGGGKDGGLDAGEPDAGGQDGGPAMLSLAPTMHAFGMVVQGALGSPRTFTASNVGGTPTSMLSVTLGGANGDQFTVVNDLCSGMTLSPQASCDLTVNFSPSGGGAKSASLGVGATAGGAASAMISGTGLLQAALGVTPLMANLGSQTAGQAGMIQQFTVTNVGDVATSAAVVPTLIGMDPGSFTISGSSCSAPLAAGGMCTVTVQFTPPTGSSGAKAASLELRPMSGPGGTLLVPLTATALSPAGLSFGAMAFGPSLIGVAVDRTFTLSNGASGATGSVSLTIGGGQASDFQLLTPSGTDCVNGVTSLAGGGTCTVRVRFIPGARGARSSTLTASATPGGLANATLAGVGQEPATLTSTVTTGAFGLVEAGVPSNPLQWTITNSGDLPSGVPVFTKTGSNPTEFTATGCGTALGPLASCAVSVTLTPTAAAARTATITAAATPGGAVSLNVSGTGAPRLTVVKVGTGTVTSSPAGISCGTTCDALFVPGTVILTAVTTNGSNAFFTGWSGGGCSGSVPSCTVTADVSKTVTATFATMTNNLAFVSSSSVAHNLGALTNYDAICNGLATAAGINTATNNGYLAWLSTSTIRARSRFGAAVRGWVRLDGKPLFDLLTDALAPTHRVYNALDRDELGALVAPIEIATATPSDDSLPASPDSCSDWTVNTGSVGYGFGYNHGGPEFWTFTNYVGCNQPSRIYCLGNTKTAPLTPAASAGKKVWLSSTPHVPSAAMTPDAHCQAEKPATVTSAKALIATTTVPASAALNPTATYVRVDGQPVGSYAELVAAGRLQSGIWQGPTGAYVRADAWTGYNGVLTNLSLAATNCTNWTTNNAATLGHSATPWATTGWWWAAVDNASCAEPNIRLICVEQ